jgi:hypothetical protein
MWVAGEKTSKYENVPAVDSQKWERCIVFYALTKRVLEEALKEVSMGG